MPKKFIAYCLAVVVMYAYSVNQGIVYLAVFSGAAIAKKAAGQYHN